VTRPTYTPRHKVLFSSPLTTNFRRKKLVPCYLLGATRLPWI
jgi:hypothetical protein